MPGIQRLSPEEEKRVHEEIVAVFKKVPWHKAIEIKKPSKLPITHRTKTDDPKDRRYDGAKDRSPLELRVGDTVTPMRDVHPDFGTCCYATVSQGGKKFGVMTSGEDLISLNEAQSP